MLLVILLGKCAVAAERRGVGVMWCRGSWGVLELLVCQQSWSEAAAAAAEESSQNSLQENKGTGGVCTGDAAAAR